MRSVQILWFLIILQNYVSPRYILWWYTCFIFGILVHLGIISSVYIWMYSVYRFIQTSYFWFIQTVILLVYLDHHTSGSCRIFIPLVHLDFFIILVHLDRHTSGTSRVFILLVHLEFSYLWFVQILFVNLVHLKIHHTFGYRSMKTLVEPDASSMSRRTRSMNRSLDEVKV